MHLRTRVLELYIKWSSEKAKTVQHRQLPGSRPSRNSGPDFTGHQALEPRSKQCEISLWERRDLFVITVYWVVPFTRRAISSNYRYDPVWVRSTIYHVGINTDEKNIQSDCGIFFSIGLCSFQYYHERSSMHRKSLGILLSRLTNTFEAI